MALVDIDDDLKERVSAWVKKDTVEYPTMKNFIDKAIKRQLERLDERKQRK